jgi:hypothetical protein
MLTPNQIFAEDKNGTPIKIGDTVQYRKKQYTVDDIEHCVSGDGYYTETMTLYLQQVGTGKLKVLEDFNVEVLG